MLTPNCRPSQPFSGQELGLGSNTHGSGGDVNTVNSDPGIFTLIKAEAGASSPRNHRAPSGERQASTDHDPQTQMREEETQNGDNKILQKTLKREPRRET